MLSILIPTYNYICVELVRDLQAQASRLSCPYEILVADDGSAEPCKVENRAINALPFCRYVEFPENMGRARIRNRLGAMAQYDWLLFMDCDAVVVRDNFLQCYVDAVRESGAKLVYGGLVHPDCLPSPDVALSYYYEKDAEPRFSLECRERHPYEVFRTFNFMVHRSVLQAHPFDEEIVAYGHEDTLFGKELKESGVVFHHIDNPLLNDGLENGPVFLQKTETSLETLYAFREKLEGTSGVLRLYGTLKRLHCAGLTALVFRMLRRPLRHNLTGSHPSLYLFAFYKIGYFCHVVSETGNNNNVKK